MRRLLGFGVVCGIACSWNAPHDNPLDPSLGGNIEGRVLTRRATGIHGAEVAVPAAGRLCRTDSTGCFLLLGLPAETTLVFFSCPGYAPDSARLGLTKGKIYSLAVYLNGLPYFEECNVTTHVYGRSWPPDPLCFLSLTATVSDSDGEPDIDSVWFEIPAVGRSGRLLFDPNTKRFVHTLWSESVPSRSLDTLVGQEVSFLVADKEGAVVTKKHPGVSRLIYELPVPVFPSGGLDTVWVDTTFVWRRFNVGFGLHYRGEVVRIEGGGPGAVAARFETPGSSDTTYRFSRALLTPGIYYWTLEAVDAFGNSSRSAEELFRVR